MYAHGNPTRAGVDRRLLAGLFVGILVAASLAFVLDSNDRLTFASPPGDGNAPTEGGRDPLLWPFSRDSIWNLPIGSDASYVHAGIKRSTAAGMTTDVDVLILSPGAPITPVYYNDDAWNGGTRCAAEGGVLFEAPIPSDFVIPGAYMGGPHGVTPNYATAILATDGMTLYQGQPSARCESGGTVTMWWYQANERLDGRGNSGAHGGSMLSSIGGTIRMGELVPGGVIRHSMKLNMNSDNFYSGLGGFRWPATTKDSCAPGCYTGSVPETRMGSLLALKPDFDFNQLETEAAKILARAFIDHGAYIADNAGWSVYGIDTEYSPSGDVIVEFQDKWGFSMEPSSKDVPWARDMDDIFLNLHVVDNWGESQWRDVAASDGNLGVGGGAPRVPWAPDFGEAPPPPPPPPPPPTLATTVTLTTSRNPSEINETVTVSGRLVDESSTPVAGRTVLLEWSGDQFTWYPEEQIGQFSPTDANGGFSGTMAFRGIGFHNEYLRARFPGDATYGASLSPVVTQAVVPPTAPPTDPTLPQVTATVSGTAGANGWYRSPVTITLTATGGTATTIYMIDNGPWTTYSAPFPIGEGRHVLVYQASDANGNHEPPKSALLEVDSVAPTLAAGSDTIVLGPDGALIWSGSDALSGIAGYEVAVDAGSFRMIGSEPRIAGPWTPGSHTATVKAYDGAGNVAKITITFRVESVAPTESPVQPDPAPTIPQGTPPTVALLALLALLLAGAAGLLYRRARRSRLVVQKVRRSVRRNSMARRGRPFDDIDEDVDYPL